jgi:hypothetical protein
MSRPTLNKPFEIAQIYQSLSTGLISGMELSINADNTKFDIGPGSGYCVDNTTVPDSPTVKKVIFDGLTAQNVTNIADQLVTYISINSDGEIIQESHIPDGEDRRDRIFIGVLVHTDNVHVEVVNNTPTLAIDTDAQLQDLMNSLGIFNIYGNSVRSFNGDLRITKTQGDIFRVGGNFQNNMKSPHKLTLPAQNPITNIQYRTQTGEVYDPSGFLDPGYYDVAGTRTALSNSSKASNQRVYVFPSGIIRIQYGQVEYNSISAAVEGLSTENYTVESNLSENALLLCTISILAGATSTSDVDDAIFIPAGKWGDVSNTGSTAVGNLQQIYNNSTTKPQIIVSSLGAVEISDENDTGLEIGRFGKISAANYSAFEDDGTLVAKGDAAPWDDLSAAIIASGLDTASGRLGYDFFNAGVKFAVNARYPDEPVIIPVQLKHALLYGTGAVLKPHFHWLQRQSAIPNFLLGYKKISQGVITIFETDFSNLTLLNIDSHAFTYVSDTLPQISGFPDIDISEMGLSDQINFVLFRDTSNASGLFSGADPVAADVTVTFQDQHARFDMLGSRQPYTK